MSDWVRAPSDQRGIPELLPEGPVTVTVYRRDGESRHDIQIGGRVMQVRPDDTAGSTRGRVITKALQELATAALATVQLADGYAYAGEGDWHPEPVDPMTYLRGRLAEIGAMQVDVIRLKEEPDHATT